MSDYNTILKILEYILENQIYKGQHEKCIGPDKCDICKANMLLASLIWQNKEESTG